MKTCSMPAVLIPLIVLSCAACGASSAGDVPATPAPASSDKEPKYRPDDLNRPASARPAQSQSDLNAGAAPAPGVHLERWAEARRIARERRRADPQARLEAEAAHQEREGTLPPHEREAMEALEQALLEELNRLRSDPTEYVAVLSEFRGFYRDGVVTVPGHMAVRTRESVAAVDDAIAVAQATPPMATLVRSPGLTRSARAYAFRLGHESQRGRGHDDSITLHRRMDAYGRVNGMFAENVGAVYRDARLMLLELFVDDGVEMRVHRWNMIGPMFRVVGLGCAPHGIYDVVCVMDFAEGFIEDPAPVKEARR